MKVVKKEEHPYCRDNGRQLLIATHPSHCLTLTITRQAIFQASDRVTRALTAARVSIRLSTSGSVLGGG